MIHFWVNKGVRYRGLENELATVYWVPCVTHNAVEAVEGGVEVGLLPQAVHLDEHLGQEDSQENEFCKIYKGQEI